MDTTTPQPQIPQQPQNMNPNVPTPEKTGAGQGIGIIIIILIIVLGGIYFWMMRSAKAPEVNQNQTGIEETKSDLQNDLDASADANIETELSDIDNELN